MTIIIENDSLITPIYTKPTDRHAFVHKINPTILDQQKSNPI